MASLAVVLLDIDGTLIDSNRAHAEAWREAFLHFDRDISLEDIRVSIGKGGDKLLAELADIDQESEIGKQISEHRGAVFREKYVPKLRAIDGGRALITKLLEADLAIGVATSASPEEVDVLLDVAGVRDLIEKKTSSGDADRSKPDPDIVQAALARFGVDPSAAILIGDTPYDIESGTRAGVRVVGVLSGGWLAGDLEGACAVYRNVRHIADQFETSPFARR